MILSPCRHQQDETGADENVRRCRVVIVGAGACGLQCAHLLTEQLARGVDHGNDEVLILEARDRVGGRIHSEPITMTTESGEIRALTMDYGAAWVHGTGHDWSDRMELAPSPENAIPQPNPMMDLLIQAAGDHIQLYRNHLRPTCRRGNPWVRPKHVLHDADDIVMYIAGTRIDPDDSVIEESLQRNRQVFRQVSKVGISMFETGQGMETASTSLQQVLDCVEATELEPTHGDIPDWSLRTMMQFHRYLLTVWYACPTTELQLAEFTRDDSDTEDDGDETRLHERYTEEGDFYGPHCTLRCGMKTVLDPFLSCHHGHERKIMCNQEVVRISDNQHCVTVATQSGLRVEADCCVVTLPIGCMHRAISQAQSMFHPELSSEKQKAIGALRVGGYKKVLLTFDGIFWPRQQVMIGMVRRWDETPPTWRDTAVSPLGNYLLFDNLWSRDGIPCIEAILINAAVEWATGKEDGAIREVVLDFMRDSMGLTTNEVHDRCVDCHVTRWEEDPYSRGAYSSYTLGTLERHTEELRTPEWNRKLVFAGEATVPEFEGSVHAALLSGIDAARQVQDYLKSRNS